MPVTNKVIMGSEYDAENISPLSALGAFYYAFNNQDATLMQSNWIQSERCSMSNPLGGIKRGWKEIAMVYEKIFNGPASVYVEFYDYTIDETENSFIAVGREKGMLRVNGTEIPLYIRTSRLYIRYEKNWKQLHHHGSMDDPALLDKYQKTLLNKEITTGEPI